MRQVFKDQPLEYMSFRVKHFMPAVDVKRSQVVYFSTLWLCGRRLGYRASRSSPPVQEASEGALKYDKMYL
jgi:hypothetical protein